MSVEAIRVSGRRPPRALFVHQLRSEQLVFWRSREAAFFIFLFPLLLFVLLGSVYSGKIYGFPAAEYLLTGLIGYGCANTAFAGLAIQLVLRRESGILKRLRSTPLPPATYIAALLVSTLIAFGPTKGYPAVLRAIGDVLPLTYLVKLVNAVYLHGDGVWTQPEALIILVAWGAAGLIFTIFKFGWEPRER